MEHVGFMPQMRALAIANIRFWGSVAPVMWRELKRWRVLAQAIEDEPLRELALAKLTNEAFNAEVAATLATLAPTARREAAVRAIVALTVLFDYLDGRTEALGGGEGALAEAQRLFGALTAAVSVAGEQWLPLDRDGDGAYLTALSSHVREQVRGLPSHGVVEQVAAGALERCAAAQSRLHGAVGAGGLDPALERWAREACVGSDLGWREYIGGCASSVLAAHALIASAAQPRLSASEAAALDAAYLAIGALITTLDSIVDEPEDSARGEAGFLALFEGPREVEKRTLALTREASTRAARAPAGAHHAMTLAGVVAYYTSHPGAHTASARGLSTDVRGELAPAIWPTLAVMRAWRAAKHVRSAWRAGRGAPEHGQSAAACKRGRRA